MNRRPVAFALISALLFGISTPLAKLLLADFPPVGLAGLLYAGAFLGLGIYSLGSRLSGSWEKSEPLARGDFPWLAGAVFFGGAIAPIALMTGLQMTTGFTTSLMLNLEIVFTALIGVFIFKEHGGPALWIALICMTVAGAMLSLEPSSGGFAALGPLLVALAMLCWAIDNNLTAHIASKNATQIAMIKTFVAGTTSLSLALLLGMNLSIDLTVILTLLLGALCYGLSLLLFIKSMKYMGSCRTSALNGVAPFFGALVSLIILGEQLQPLMLPAIALMALGSYILLKENHSHLHRHEGFSHSHHHSHREDHQHHRGAEENLTHDHQHYHEEVVHTHEHWPDQEHRHKH